MIQIHVWMRHRQPGEREVPGRPLVQHRESWVKERRRRRRRVLGREREREKGWSHAQLGGLWETKTAAAEGERNAVVKKSLQFVSRFLVSSSPVQFSLLHIRQVIFAFPLPKAVDGINSTPSYVPFFRLPSVAVPSTLKHCRPLTGQQNRYATP